MYIVFLTKDTTVVCGAVMRVGQAIPVGRVGPKGTNSSLLCGSLTFMATNVPSSLSMINKSPGFS